MKVYRIRHKPTGLYYQPAKGRWVDTRSHLGPNGKIYVSGVPKFKDICGNLSISESICKKYNIKWEEYHKFNQSDFEIIEYDCFEVKKETK